MLTNMKPHNVPEIPDELKPTSISFKTAFWVAFAIHALIGVGFAASPVLALKAKEEKKQQVEGDKKALEEPAPVYVGVPDATPIPAPIPKQTNADDWPHKKVSQVKTTSVLTKEYVVMPGDTFYSIVKKYKLDPIKLQRLNNITDVNKLTAGQKLKFF